VQADRSGYSPGYDVRDSEGLEWSVKIGPEAQTEVVASRILWAIGYHQVPVYYLPTWTMKGGPEGATPGGGRFRPELTDRKVVSEWSWYENEFADTQPFRGLVVANLLLNNWDWKTSNNKVYETTEPGGATEQRMIVQDLGASLGKTSYPTLLAWLPMSGLGQGSRNDLEDFESQGFIRRVDHTRVEFDYRGIHRNLVNTVRTGDVLWACRLMARLSDEQWDDAFRAAGYDDAQRARYIAKIKTKVAQGLAVGEDRRAGVHP
jgi:hypothetical protein